jgi:hypothetical protein
MLEYFIKINAIVPIFKLSGTILIILDTAAADHDFNFYLYMLKTQDVIGVKIT